jgi:hypothetical protein
LKKALKIKENIGKILCDAEHEQIVKYRPEEIGQYDSPQT